MSAFNILLSFKGERPLCVLHHEPSQAMFHSSRYAKDAMNELDQAVREVEILLDTQQAEPLSSTPKPKSLRQVLALFIPLAERGSAVSDLEDITGNLRDKRHSAKRAFKLFWYLYTISQRAYTGAIFSMDQSGTKSLTRALDAVSYEFISHPFGHPFGICRPCDSFSLSVLNHDHDAASRQEELARKLGRGWIDDRVNRRHVPANQLIDVQITLFELIWSGTVSQLKGNLARSTNDPEHREYETILDQLDSSLQEVIARSKRDRKSVV